MSEVTWRPIPGFESYSASSDGQIRNKSGKVLKPARKEDGYMQLTLTINQFSVCKFVHNVVALAFLENPDCLPEIDHKNRIRDDNRVDNLEWVSKAENRARRLLKSKNELKGDRTAVWKCDKETGDKIELYRSLRDAADAIGVKWCGSICNVIKGRRTTAHGFKWILEGHRDIADEIWKPLSPELVNGETGNFISSEGRVKNKFGTVREGYIHTSGYKRVCIGNKDFMVHRLVAQMFLPNFFGHELVNHKDGNKLNPRMYNLQWISPSGNILHALSTGLVKRHVPVRQLSLDGTLVAEFGSISEAVTATGCSHSGISFAAKRNTVSGCWRWALLEQDIQDKPLNDHSAFAGRVRPVRQLSLEGVKIADFPNISRAAKAVNYNRTAFRRGVLRNKGVWAGYKWEFLT